MGGSVIGKAGALLLVVLTVGQAIPPSAAEAPPESGTWYIDGDVVLRDGTYYFNDSVTINISGSLAIENASLIFNSPDIVFLVYGLLKMDRTSLSKIESQYYTIRIESGSGIFSNSSFENVSITILWGGDARFTSCDFSGPGTGRNL